MVRNFVLDAAKVSRSTGGAFVICPMIRRAPGFNRPLRLSIGASASTSILGVVQPGTDSSGAVEVRTSEHALTLTIDAGGSGANLALSETVQVSP